MTNKNKIEPKAKGKVCSGCKEAKSYAAFGKNKSKTDKHDIYCKQCRYVQRRQPDMHFKMMFARIQYRVNSHPLYANIKTFLTWEEFQSLRPQYNVLHAAWANSGYTRGLTPCIDRIDSSDDYHIGNVQIITVSQNSGKDIYGSAHWNSKLNALSIETIKWLYTNFDSTQKQIARMFGVHRVHVGDIVKGDRWSYNKYLSPNQEKDGE